MIGQSSSHSWCTGRAHMRGFAQLMMRKTEIAGASDQIPPRLERSKATGCMAGFARQAGQPLPEGSIQALNKSRVEAHATMREQKQLLCLGQQAMRSCPEFVEGGKLRIYSFQRRERIMQKVQ